ncbi:MAG: DUF3883 domain-containing protein [Phycisphaerales bacterium]|nr:DUF3883 domain-containing protein [Phycisphaerales bacterium]
MSKQAPAVLFCNTAWMREYRGNVKADPPFNGGSWIAQHGTGFEIHNFLPYRGRIYGYVANAPHFTIAIEKLGAPSGAESVKGVRVFWTATHPKGGRFIVGWYDDATIYRSMEGRRHPSPDLESRNNYNIVVDAKNAHLIPLDNRRLYPVPDCRKPEVPWGMGQSNVRFMDDRGLPFLREVETRLGAKSDGPAPKQGRRTGSDKPGRQPDPAKRIEVEHAAMSAIRRRFEADWELEDRSRKMGLGYDFLAKPRAARSGEELLLEVKGCSSSGIVCELTPSERACMTARATRDQYRLCVVTDALDDDKRQVHIFEYHVGVQQWTADGGRVLEVEELVGARCSSG